MSCARNLLLVMTLAAGCGPRGEIDAPGRAGKPADAGPRDRDAGPRETDAASYAAGSSGSPAGRSGAAAGFGADAAAYGGGAGAPSSLDSGTTEPPAAGSSRLIGVDSFGLRGRSDDGASWSYCGSPSQADEHTPELLRAVAYGGGVFVAVGGDANGLVMRSLDGEHWDEDVHPLDACPEETYPSSCRNWMGAVAYLDGVWLAGGGNGATMRSEDAGRSWQGLHKGFPEKHIRSLGAGAGRFIAGSDGGSLYVTSDRGDSWQEKTVWSGAPASASLLVAYGADTFIAYDAEGEACFVSSDLGASWQPCAATARGGSAYLYDGKQWIAALDGSYATSPDAQTWTEHVVTTFPRRLLFDGENYFGRSGSTVYRAVTLGAFEVVAREVADFRAWTVGRVLSENLPVLSPAACVDRR